MTDDDSPVRVAQDNLCPHINQLVDKEQTAFEHLLMNQHTALGLGSHNQHHAQQVRSQSRPRRIGDGHDGTVDERFNLVMLLSRNVDIVATLLQPLYQKPSESIGSTAPKNITAR